MPHAVRRKSLYQGHEIAHQENRTAGYIALVKFLDFNYLRSFVSYSVFSEYQVFGHLTESLTLFRIQYFGCSRNFTYLLFRERIYFLDGRFILGADASEVQIHYTTISVYAGEFILHKHDEIQIRKLQALLLKYIGFAGTQGLHIFRCGVRFCAT